MKNLMKKLLLICVIFMGMKTLNSTVNVRFGFPIPDLSQYPEFKIGNKPKTVEFSIDSWVEQSESISKLVATSFAIIFGTMAGVFTGGAFLAHRSDLDLKVAIPTWLALVALFGPGLYKLIRMTLKESRPDLKEHLNSIKIQNRTLNCFRFVSITSQKNDLSIDLYPFGTKIVFVTSYQWAKPICETMNANFERLAQQWWEDIKGSQLVYQ